MSATLTDVYDLPAGAQGLPRHDPPDRRTSRSRPRAAEIDATGEYPWDIRKLFAEQDILGLPFPSEYGGTGTGTLMLNDRGRGDRQGVRLERADPDGPGARHAADPALRLRRAQGALAAASARRASGRRRSACREPEAGSDPAAMRTTRRARRRRVGHQRHQELDHERGDRRLLRRVRGHRPRGAALERVRRREGPRRASACRQARAQARHQGLADRLSRSSRTCACPRRT